MANLHTEQPLLGAFVKVTSARCRDFGIGKVSRLSGNQATVTYFDVPGDPEQFEIQEHVSALRVVDLPEQTRVFWMDDATGRWRVGRVVDGEGPTIFVAFPNKVSVSVPRADLQVRWRQPIKDPVAFLARHVTETPRFAEARSDFMRSLTEQRAACRGMGALLSSTIQLVDYQFNVVQRVLQDPVQRYLLADEVGLGKTVEAGLLIRQYILDFTTSARALIVVPNHLVQQWRDELRQSFNLDGWLDDFVFIVSADELQTIRQLLPSVGMLVVDEAHHLSRQGDDGSNPLYDLLRRHAPRVPRLLLLSATPVLADTAGFLRILHLLDPVVFRLDDLASFERRLEARQLVAEVAAALVPENVLSMEDDLDRLERAFNDDAELVERVRALRPIVQRFPSEDDEAFNATLGQLRAHLTETYKLHRRILRNRRRNVPWATPQRSGLEVVSYRCPFNAERSRTLDDLRVHLVNAEIITPVVQSIFSAAVHACGLLSVDAALLAADINDQKARELAQRVDTLARDSIQDGARLNALVDAVRRLIDSPGVQVVVFCDRIDSAERVADALNGLLPRGFVQRHTPPATGEGIDGDVLEPWRLFLTDPARCRILVCDVRAEEGLNLHGGRKIAVHFDLPASPNRIEQRLGRLDRFGAGDAVRSLALVCVDDPSEQAWIRCLDTGLQVFNASMASLQYLVEATLRAAVMDWAGEGAEGLLRWCAELEGPNGWTARERRRIDQQDTLDAMGDPQSDAFESLEAVDNDWQSWRMAFNGFAIRALQFRPRPEEWVGPLPPQEQVYRLNYARDATHNTLLPLSTFVSEFIGTIDTASRHSNARSPLTHAYAFRRSTALSKEGRLRQVRPLRYGDSLVESFQAFCNRDDRGRVFAMWRQWPDYEPRDSSGIDLYFRFDFIIEPNLVDNDNDATRALRRRAEAHLAPQFRSVWVEMGGAESLDGSELLTAPYRPTIPAADGGGRDYNLNAARWLTLQSQTDNPWTNFWNRHCTEASKRARAFIDAHDTVRDLISMSLRSLQVQHQVRSAQLISRAARLADSAREAELAELLVERATHSQLHNALRAPSIRTDVVGAVFLSPTTPFAK